VYRDARVLDPDVLPDTLQHRDVARNQATKAIGPLRDGRPPRPVRIQGASGVGKTTVARVAVHQLHRAGTAVREASVTLFSDNTRAAVFHAVLRDIGQGTRFDYRSPAAELREEVRSAAASRPLVVVADEAAHVRTGDQAVYRELYEMADVALVLVDRDLTHLFADCADSTAARLREGLDVRLSGYAPADLVDILDTRVRAALHDPDRVTPAAHRLIAETVDGNAREGIVLLRSAVERVHGTGRTVTVDTVSEVETDARTRLHDRALGHLDSRYRLVYELLADEGPLTGAELHGRLEAECGRDVTPRTRRRRVAYLRDLRLVREDGETSDATYRAVSPGGAATTGRDAASAR
jgi:Cdc6-like AAA superfamily ATPase